jgi:hypothetical protein
MVDAARTARLRRFLASSHRSCGSALDMAFNITIRYLTDFEATPLDMPLSMDCRGAGIRVRGTEGKLVRKGASPNCSLHLASDSFSCIALLICCIRL